MICLASSEISVLPLRALDTVDNEYPVSLAMSANRIDGFFAVLRIGITPCKNHYRRKT